MPTYHYQCRDCGHSFDQFQKFSEDPLTVCPSCGGAVQRVIQNVGVVFKGSGWYITDSRKSSDTSSDGSAKKDSTKNSTKPASDSTKPETNKKEPAAAAPATKPNSPSD
jgi:putative FmdB family regulatory protein